MPLTLTALREIPLIRQGDDLAAIILNGLANSKIELQDNDILVVAQKIISKAEGRMVNLAKVTPGREAQRIGTRVKKDPRVVELMLGESRKILRSRPGTIIVEHNLGFICANAGIDHSNVAGGISGVDEFVLLLPENPDHSAALLRTQIEGASGKKIGVMIIDSHGRAWRIGTQGVCIGLSGLPAVVDERGWKDLFGYQLRITVVGVADELAGAASLIMGQAAEGTPVVHVNGFPYPLREGSFLELIRPEEEDLFR
jgi:coenzyme F420-0:L-glutamate ligase / coenzyme F420-1:gamma-L-glutamate ligase